MLELVDKYIEARSFAWSRSTQISERSRLRSVSELITLTPQEAYSKLKQTHKPYTIKTAFIRMGEFYQWLIDTGVKVGPNPFKAFTKDFASLFKNAYTKERLSVEYADAVSRINSIKNEQVRIKALELLATGCRWTESFTEHRGVVTGKGGRSRRIFRPAEFAAPLTNPPSYTTFRRELSSVGLKPHTLRKLAATRFVECGAREADLLALMGWTSIQTASSYLQSKSDEGLAHIVSQAFANAK